jgi:hypothetical protein
MLEERRLRKEIFRVLVGAKPPVCLWEACYSTATIMTFVTGTNLPRCNPG